MTEPNEPPRDYHPGMIVEMSTHLEWGPGKIGHINSDKLHITFRYLETRPTRVFLTDNPALRMAAIQNDPILDNYPPLVKREDEWQLPRQPMPIESAKQKFMQTFPGGFAGQEYVSADREFKLKANRRFQEELGPEEAQRLLASDDVATLIGRGSSILSAAPLIASFESAAFHDAMLDKPAARAYYAALFRLLAAPQVTEAIFEDYADAVISLPAKRGRVATWAVATALPYIAYPERFMFLKPEVTQAAADILQFDLHYKAQLNWATYVALLKMGQTYLELLKPMGARDFVDVQTFIFVVGGGY